ncbi:MAG: hypothetical protein M3Q29_06485 [Chloroflexota bacterium]|nr:hypothetical protein [Chloroflexota bacterium]
MLIRLLLPPTRRRNIERELRRLEHRAAQAARGGLGAEALRLRMRIRELEESRR